MESLPNELKNCKIDNVKTTMIWEKNYDVQIGKGDDISNRRDWTCYTDVSKSGLKSGSGSVILHLNKVHTNFFESIFLFVFFVMGFCSGLSHRSLKEGMPSVEPQ